MFLLISKTLLEKFADFHWGLGVMLQNVKVIHTTIFGWFMENPPHIVWFIGFGVFHKNQVQEGFLRSHKKFLNKASETCKRIYSSEEFTKKIKKPKITYLRLNLDNIYQNHTNSVWFLWLLWFYTSRRCFVRSRKNFLDKQSETCQNIYSLNDFPQIWKSPKLRKSHIWVENWSIYTQIYII